MYSPNNKKICNIIWFNPPFSESVTTNNGKKFFSQLAKHFPPSNRLYKIINKQNVKLSYSCLTNMQGFIANCNKRLFNISHRRKKERPPATALVRQIVLWMVFAAKNPSFPRRYSIHQMTRQCHIMTAIKRIFKHIITIIFGASKTHPRETKQSSQSW